ncbi:pyridoxamine 5'-phosphate oxidase family protein [Patulibacter sp. NPDC049589]|uniref:pyridoxamine 5'-phosphate oxidase family protein n=1 Tax=Patulibacter sp. NPDC049589 TaxID=3154731 RepID=UPI0034453B61
MDDARIETLDELRAIVGEPIPRVRDKARATLHELDRQWLAASPFCLVGTADAEGRCDVSPKGDPAGKLVHVVDERTIALPERPGNRRIDGLRNVLENPHVGLNFLIPGRGDTLRVNGRAHVVRDASWFDELLVAGHRPALALVVGIDEVFHHCAKAFLRSQLWDPGSWDPDAVVPPRAAIAKVLERPDDSIEELEAYYGPAYARRLYD